MQIDMYSLFFDQGYIYQHIKHFTQHLLMTTLGGIPCSAGFGSAILVWDLSGLEKNPGRGIGFPRPDVFGM